MNPQQLQNVLILCMLIGFALMEVATRRQRNMASANSNDTKLELLMFVGLLAVVQPFTILVTAKLGMWLFPDWKGALAGLPWWAMVGILLIGDDMTQYWYHRLAHSPFLWPLHRAHHSAPYMSIRITFRNNFFYYLLMPGLWIAGALLYLGFGGFVYTGYIVTKLFIIIGAHCAWRWDAPLYRNRALRPLMWLLEHTISTPATHWAHHALTNEDGVGHNRGNFGNMLFLWDLLFGSAIITRKYPEQVGLKDDHQFGQERWQHQLFYPVLQSKRVQSDLKLGSNPGR